MKNGKKLLSIIATASLPILTTVSIASCGNKDTGEQVKAIDESKFTWDESGDTPLLTKVDFSDTSKNTLLLPAKHNNKIYAIQEGAFLAEDGKTTLIPNNIIRLMFKDITAITIPAKAFYNAPFKIIDLKEQEANYHKDVAKIEFGENSFAFATTGATGEGKIEYNDVFNEGLRNDLQNKFWQAGLKSPSWYAFTEVNTEQELRKAAWNGGNIYLNADIVLSSPIEFKSTSALLDLYGHKISSNQVFKDDNNNITGLIRIYNSDLIVYDSTDKTGSIRPFKSETPNGEGSYAFHCLNSGTQHSSSLTIYGGTYYGTQTVIYNEAAKVYIKSVYNGSAETFVPKFHVYTWNGTDTIAYKMLDCVDEAITQGLASFETSSGEYYWTQTGTTVTEDYTYNPYSAKADDHKDWIPSGFKCDNVENKMYKVSKS